MLVSLMAEGFSDLFGDLFAPLRNVKVMFNIREDPVARARKMLEEFLAEPQYTEMASSIRKLALGQLPPADQLAIISAIGLTSLQG